MSSISQGEEALLPWPGLELAPGHRPAGLGGQLPGQHRLHGQGGRQGVLPLAGGAGGGGGGVAGGRPAPPATRSGGLPEEDTENQRQVGKCFVK